MRSLPHPPPALHPALLQPFGQFPHAFRAPDRAASGAHGGHLFLPFQQRAPQVVFGEERVPLVAA